MTSYEEWRVTGRWAGFPFEKTFLPEEGYDAPEADARAFVARQANESHNWADGPRLSRRTVTVTDWEEAP